MKQEVWIIGLDREVWIGLDRRSGSGVSIACGFWGLIRTSNFEVQPYRFTGSSICWPVDVVLRMTGVLNENMGQHYQDE